MKTMYWSFRGFFLAGTLLAAAIAAHAQLPTEAMPSLAPLVKSASPAVVNIRVSQTIQAGSQYGDEMFRRFFGLPEIPGGGSHEVASAGSGVIVDAENGYILTNHHVVQGADKIEVYLFNEDSLDAEVVGSDAATDIAVLKVEPKNLVEIAIGDSDKVEVGDFVIAIGNPFGLGNTVTSGIVSAVGRTGISQNSIGTNAPIEDFIQTDASINPEFGRRPGEHEGRTRRYQFGHHQPHRRQHRHRLRHAVRDRPLHHGADPGFRRSAARPSRRHHRNNRRGERKGTGHRHHSRGAGLGHPAGIRGRGRLRLEVDDIIVKVDDKKIDDSRALANAIGLKGSGDEVEIELVRNGKPGPSRQPSGNGHRRKVSARKFIPRLRARSFLPNRPPAAGGSKSRC